MTHKKKAAKKFVAINLMTIRKWHWMSSALCFLCMLLFAVTGITLNHAGGIESKPQVTRISGQLPAPILASLATDGVTTHENGAHESGQKELDLPDTLTSWLAKNHGIDLTTITAEINDSELYLPQTRPGGDAWLSIDTQTGEFEFEDTDRGWIAYFNDLHKGRNTGNSWIYFMDVFAIACIIFSITGFMLLQRYADTRRQTWPLLMAGMLVPILLMMFLVHR